METISWDHFEEVDLRIGTIEKVEEFPEAREPAYKLWVNFGTDIGVKKSSAQITDLYSKDNLIGKQVIGVINFPPKQIGSFMSECLVTGFYQNGKEVVLAVPDQQVSNGKKLC